MNVRIHQHAAERANERGTSTEEINDTVLLGEQFPAKQNRTGFRRTIIFNSKWQDKHYYAKQIECYAVEENDDWVVISVVVKYF